MEKVFRLKRTGASISVIGMGRIMFRPEADDIVSRFGSEVKGLPGESVVDFMPPIERDRLDELGGALVDLAKLLDPNPPEPTYRIE